MFESNSKFPKIFVYMMSLLAVIMFIGMFFGVVFVGSPYFIAVLICAVILILDRRYGSILTNYKLTYFLFEIVNLIAMISVVYYEYSKHTEMLNIFLILLIAIEVVMAIIDIFLLKNKNLTKIKNVIIDFIKLCSMICIMTYFFNVSKLYFAIFAFVFESMNLAVKISTYFENLGKKQKTEPETENQEKTEKIEDIIHSNSEGDGE